MTTKECQRCADFLDDDNVEKAAWYCPDCPDDRQLLCSKCCGLEHHVGTQSENHSFEELDVNRSCHLFSAVFDAMTFYLSLALGLRYMYLLWHIGNVWQPYLDGHDVCPLTAKVRTWWASWDTGLLYLAKLVMVPNNFCAWEDGYWRIYADMWIRSIVTDTDGWFLMISVLPRAFWFHFAFVWVLAPFIVVAHALLSAAVNAVELRLAARLLDRKQEPGKIARLLHTLNDKIAPRAPPATKPRARRMINFVDGMSYWLRRRMRNVSFYYYKASARLGIRSLPSRVWMLQGMIARRADFDQGASSHVFRFSARCSFGCSASAWGSDGFLDFCSLAWASGRCLRRTRAGSVTPPKTN